MVTNLDIWYDIESMMDKAESEMESYLKVLSDRHEYMTSYRQEYRKLNEAISNVKNSLIKAMNENEENQKILRKVLNKIDERIETLQQERHYNPDEPVNDDIKDLQKAKDILYTKKLKEDDLQEASIILSKRKLTGTGIDELTLSKAANSTLEKVMKLIESTENDYLGSFKEYKQSCEHSDEVFESFDDIVGVLLEYRFAEEANELINSLPDIEETRRQRPDHEQLLGILVPIRSNGLEYWKSNYKNSHAHDYNIAFADAVAYARRALLENREFKGTESAFNDLRKAYKELEKYMKARYHELGGTPHNYHGHDNRH